MTRPGSSFEENSGLATIAERMAQATLELARQSEGEAARQLEERLTLARNLGEFETAAAIALLSQRVLESSSKIEVLEERIARLEE